MGTFHLIELAPELCKLVDTAIENKMTQPIFSIKGHPTENAVLCSPDKTYTLCSLVLSNTILVLTPSRTDPDGMVHVRDQLHEVLELVPSVPKSHKLPVLACLRGLEYDDGDEDQRATLPRYTYEQAQAEIQASDAELKLRLKERCIPLHT